MEISRRVAAYAHLGRVAGLALDLVLPEPVVAALEIENASPVRVDVDAAVVGPRLAGPETNCAANESLRSTGKILLLMESLLLGIS